jgi:hypothetical protein
MTTDYKPGYPRQVSVACTRCGAMTKVGLLSSRRECGNAEICSRRIELRAKQRDVIAGSDHLIEPTGETRIIQLSKGLTATIDSCDWPRISIFPWHALKARRDRFYAAGRSLDGDPLLMHRIIMRAREDEVVDHENGNGLDNRRLNLRRCTNSQNLANMPGRKVGRYKGVHKRDGSFRAQIMVMYRTIRIGRFATEEDAAKAYDAAAIKYFGEFAHTNFPIAME